MVFSLLLTNQEDLSCILVENELNKLGFPFLRFNTDLAGSEYVLDTRIDVDTVSSSIYYSGTEWQGVNVFSVWNRRPMDPVPPLFIRGKEARILAAQEIKAQLDGFLGGLNTIWLSPPESLRKASYKVAQLQMAHRLGFTIPRTLVSTVPGTIRDFYQDLKSSGKKTIAKLVSKGSPRADKPDNQYVIFTTVVTETDLSDDAILSCCPATYQEYIEKKYELRITIIDQCVFACEIHSQETESTKIDWRRYDLDNTPHKIHHLNDSIKRKCLDLMNFYGLKYAAIDMIVTPDDRYFFVEMNPNGQWGWIEELTGLPISRSIAEFLAQGYCR